MYSRDLSLAVDSNKLPIMECYLLAVFIRHNKFTSSKLKGNSPRGYQQKVQETTLIAGWKGSDSGYFEESEVYK